MPPDDPLPEDEQALIRNWIGMGARGLQTQESPGEGRHEHWSFRLLQPVVVPRVKNDAICRNDIDRFLQAALESRGLELGPEADRSTLIRRVSFDVTGLPPSVEEISNYLHKSATNAYEQMMEGYLSSLRHGERWGKYWLDIAGYADSNGYFDADTLRPFAYRYRDYVIPSLNNDKPFDQFIREQLAGDELVGNLDQTETSPEVIQLLEATHFLCNMEDGTEESSGHPDLVLHDRFAVLDANLEMFGSALFGLSLQCAKCHDHKFEPITQRDYYGLQAVLAPAFNVQNWRGPSERYVTAATRKKIATFEAALKHGRCTEADHPRKIAAVRDVTEVPPDVFILNRGDFKMPGERVSPSGPAILANEDNVFSKNALDANRPGTGYRLAFAQWLTRPNTRPAALLARLQVNRIWQHYFGTGLVATPENFGYSGERPAYPEFLEWLTGLFVKSGWSSKAVHRLILESAAYRQSSATNRAAYELDPDNRWLWRMPLRRLDAEAIYDALLATSGELDLNMGGPATPTVAQVEGEVSVVKSMRGGKRRAVIASLVPQSFGGRRGVAVPVAVA